jgi:tyrosine-protein phosphatase SIW14
LNRFLFATSLITGSWRCVSTLWRGFFIAGGIRPLLGGPLETAAGGAPVKPLPPLEVGLTPCVAAVSGPGQEIVRDGAGTLCFAALRKVMERPTPRTTVCPAMDPTGIRERSRLRSRTFRLALAGLVLAVAAAASVWIYRENFYLKRFQEVEAGILYRSALPSNDRLLRRALAKSGARTIVILRSLVEREFGDWYEREMKLAREQGVVVETVPLGHNTPPSREEVQRFLSIVDDTSRRPVLCHCEVGAIRTGMMAAVYRMERQGWSAERANEEFLEFADDHAGDDAMKDVRDFIRNYRPQFPR